MRFSLAIFCVVWPISGYAQAGELEKIIAIQQAEIGLLKKNVEDLRQKLQKAQDSADSANTAAASAASAASNAATAANSAQVTANAAVAKLSNVSLNYTANVGNNPNARPRFEFSSPDLPGKVLFITVGSAALCVASWPDKETCL